MPAALSGSFGVAVPRKRPHGVVPRLHWSSPDVGAYLKRGEPLVLAGGCPLAAPLQSWSVAHFTQHLSADADAEPWPVHFTPRHERSFSRIYGHGLGEGGVRNFAFGEFARALAQQHVGPEPSPPSPCNLYLQVLLRWARGGAELERRGLGPRLDAELDEAVGSGWLRDACGQLRHGPDGADAPDAPPESRLEACQLWASHGGVSTPLHYDGSDNFLAQLRGRKRVLLFSPADSFRLYPFPVGHPKDNYSLVDAERPDLKAFPAFAAARGRVAEIGEGDVLFLPRFWWHFVAQPEPRAETLSLNYWLSSGRSLRHYEWLSMRGVAHPRKVLAFWVGKGSAAAVADEVARLLECEEREERDSPSVGAAAAAALEALSERVGTAEALRCIHASRMAESAATLVCGSERLGGRLLAALARGDDGGWPPAADGAREFAGRLRAEVGEALDGVLSEGGADALFALITMGGRLHPGLAPEVSGPVVSSERGDVSDV